MKLLTIQEVSSIPFGVAGLVVLGVVIVVVVLFMPQGIGGVLRARMARWKRGLK